MTYPLLKNLHVTLAVISIGGFALRWWWMKAGSALFHYRLTRVLPHVVDTLFLASGIWLAIVIRQYPFVHGWLTAKIFGLIAYIVLATLALKRAPTERGKNVAFVAAMAVVAWIVAVARGKSAWVW